jgi:drug/metabolite transporter (DMT)-like permease
MAVPILAILVDYVFINVKFSTFDLLALIFIVTGIYIVAKKPFNINKNAT